ncbi:hypothetical protein ACF07S_10575 [Streptomyces sp. NPDC016640]|uniref:hypothetical protein n=1 Tax=Streptomyces sp. NPDC016640 TaxID=3364969 RepID=UPI0036FE13A6
MYTKHAARQELDARGPRYAIWVELGKDEAQVIYADTATQAEKIRERRLAEYSGNEQRVQLHPPAASISLTDAAGEREKVKVELAEKTAALKAVALQALEDGRAEAEVAREARVDRMTIRSWAGKR